MDKKTKECCTDVIVVDALTEEIEDIKRSIDKLNLSEDEDKNKYSYYLEYLKALNMVKNIWLYKF